MDLNNLKTRTTGIDGGVEEHTLRDYSIPAHVLCNAKTAVYFRDLQRNLLFHLNNADGIVGCVAWFTDVQILRALSSKIGVSIIMQKEEFLRPDLNQTESHYTWKQILRSLYNAIHPIESPVNFYAGWLEKRDIRERSYPGNGTPMHSIGLRCVGQSNQTGNTIPRMHHKFIVFLRHLDSTQTKDGGWPYHPYAVWTGSFNITKNGSSSLENAVYIEDEEKAQAYCNEWTQLTRVSESLDWTSKYVTQEIDLNTGAIYS